MFGSNIIYLVLDLKQNQKDELKESNSKALGSQ